MKKLVVYAFKDADTGLFYNRIHKCYLPLMQNTTFYKTKKSAEKQKEYLDKIRIEIINKGRKYPEHIPEHIAVVPIEIKAL